jgi:hypothetical protein
MTYGDGTEEIRTIFTGEWFSGFDSEVREHLGQDSNGQFYYALERSPAQELSGPNWIGPYPSLDKARNEYDRAFDDWMRAAGREEEAWEEQSIRDYERRQAAQDAQSRTTLNDPEDAFMATRVKQQAAQIAKSYSDPNPRTRDHDRDQLVAVCSLVLNFGDPHVPRSADEASQREILASLMKELPYRLRYTVANAEFLWPPQQTEQVRSIVNEDNLNHFERLMTKVTHRGHRAEPVHRIVTEDAVICFERFANIAAQKVVATLTDEDGINTFYSLSDVVRMAKYEHTQEWRQALHHRAMKHQIDESHTTSYQKPEGERQGNASIEERPRMSNGPKLRLVRKLDT